MLAMHEDERPSDTATAFEWIHAELTRQGLHDDAAYAARDGYRCGEAALEIIYCLEKAAQGFHGERVGTGVARFYRSAVMNETYRTAVSPLERSPTET
ncbi:hypothetical protein FRZ40_32375 [Paraburkholderia azotifigens]|uniref:Uncharacterized protein n=2 Tax=Paraburkholderia azotifigens TaxID=2057004 RepID=A0A5C6V9K4_9BURK|nr:hypothetical protein FRZ40_32375 [Paraburkholderia azotifigens]